jgi:hypothetical protein
MVPVATLLLLAAALLGLVSVPPRLRPLAFVAVLERPG